jgi:hypothetical protein
MYTDITAEPIETLARTIDARLTRAGLDQGSPDYEREFRRIVQTWLLSIIESR